MIAWFLPGSKLEPGAARVASGQRCRSRTHGSRTKLHDGFWTIQRPIGSNGLVRTPEARLEGGTDGLLEPFGVTRFESGQGNHLLELFSIALDPSEHRERLLFRAVTHIEHGAAQYGDPQNLLGALRWREGRG